jgi:hypothetical protein
MKTAIIVLGVLLLTVGGIGALMFQRAEMARRFAMNEEMRAREASARAQEEHARAQAVTDFLHRVLTPTDAQGKDPAQGLTVDDLLDQASRRVETELANDPELAARLQAAILRAKETPPTPANDDRR